MIHHFLLWLSIFLALQTNGVSLAQELTEEGKAMKAAHDLLFSQIVNESNATFKGQDSWRKLTRVVISDDSIDVQGETDIKLPPSIEQVLHFFRYIELAGSGLDQLGGISLLPTSPSGNLNVSTKSPSIYRVKVPTLPVPGADTPQFSIRLRGSATISSITLVSFGKGIDLNFDTIPYRNLGHDSVPQKATLDFDLNRELSIEGHVLLDRSKWFRYYGIPNKLPPAFEQFARDQNFVPGRQIFKFQPMFENYSPGKLVEDPNRPGFVKASKFDTYIANQFQHTARDYGDLKFAMCFNDYPDFMSVEHVGRGTPLPERFPGAADLVVKFLQNQIRDSGRTATWWELKNESSIKAEWDYHFRPNTDSWKLLAEFHNTVADAVHQNVEGVKIGGPTSAWMQVQVKDFFLWEKQKRFMDLTNGHLDFYSHHFYEDTGTLGAFERRQDGYANYLLGRFEAIMEMFRAHMHATDNVRPILITEYGALNVGKSESDYWLRLRSNCAYVIRMMKRPHQIDLAVPFIFLASPWDKQSGYATLVPDADKDSPESKNDLFVSSEISGYRLSPNRHFFELWRDFQGRRIPVELDLPFVETIGVRDGNTVQIAINNMNGRRLELDFTRSLHALKNENQITKISQRRFYRIDGKIRLEEHALTMDALLKVPVEVEETTVITLMFEKPLRPSKTIHQQTFYAPITAVKPKELPKQGLQILIPDSENYSRAQLQIGIHCRGGLKKPILATVNGHTVSFDSDEHANASEIFNLVSMELPVSVLGNRNMIDLEVDQSGVTVTSVQITTESIR